MTIPNPERPEDGFTLIETLIAFLVLSLSLMILAQSTLQATTQVRTADTVTSARLLAESLRPAAEAAEDARAGTDGATDLAWRWRKRAFERSDPQSDLPTFVLTTIEIFRRDQPRPIFVLKTVGYEDEAP